jgi:hypothetical protein
MHNITTSAHGLSVEMRPDGKHTREVFVDDVLECSASPLITSIMLIDQPGGASASIDGTTITCHEVGRHLFKVTFSDGKSAHLHVVACEVACLARVPDQQQDRHLPPRSLAEKSLILRSLANHAPNFDGSAASISFDRVGSLAQYGV